MAEAVALIGCKGPEQEFAYREILAAGDAGGAARPVPGDGRRGARGGAGRHRGQPRSGRGRGTSRRSSGCRACGAGIEKLVGAFDRPLPIVRLVDREMARTMAEAVLAWTFYLQRDMPAYARQQRERVWRPHGYRKPVDVTVGLLGLGALGAEAAVRLLGAGFPVVGWSRSPKAGRGRRNLPWGPTVLAAMLGRCDILVCLVPLTAETRGLVNAARLAALKPGAAVINFARGPIVVTEDLIAALDGGRLAHAVLDVFDVEPLPADSALWSHPGVTVLPHVSGPTDMGSAAATVAANLRSYRKTGEPPQGVDAARGY